MTWTGPLADRASQAAGAAVQGGATALEALIVGEAASWPIGSWQNDRKTAEAITQANGRNPHPRSVARSRRNVSRKGFLDYRRILPGQTPPGARFPSVGTTFKTVNFRGLGCRDPIPSEQRRKMRKRPGPPAGQRASVEPSSQERTSYGPRHSAPTRVVMDPELERVVSTATASMQRKWEREEQTEDAAMLASCPPPTKPPD